MQSIDADPFDDRAYNEARRQHGGKSPSRGWANRLSTPKGQPIKKVDEQHDHAVAKAGDKTMEQRPPIELHARVKRTMQQLPHVVHKHRDNEQSDNELPFAIAMGGWVFF